MPLPPRTPELAALDLLASVAELGSVGKAAAAHGISQPSASADLARLERRLGITLLHRSTTGSRPTPQGEAVLAWAGPVLQAARELTDAAATLRGEQRRQLRIGASLTIAEYLLPGWLPPLRSESPELEASVRVGNSDEVQQWLRAGEIDVGFVETPQRPAGLGAQLLGYDRIAASVAPGHPLATGAPVSPATLRDQTLLLREPGSGTRETFLQALAEATAVPVAQLRLPHAIELGSTTTIVSTAVAGGGVAIVSATVLSQQLSGGGLVELQLPELALARPLHALWRGPEPTRECGALIAVAAGATSDSSLGSGS